MTHDIEGDLRDALLPLRDWETATGGAPDDLVAAVLAVIDEAALDRMAEQLLGECRMREMDFRNGLSMNIEPARELVAAWVAAARTMLGEAPNYSETRIDMPPTDDDPKVSMTVKLAGELERYSFVLQRVGKLTPHEARMQAEAELEDARGTLRVLSTIAKHGDMPDETRREMREALGDPS